MDRINKGNYMHEAADQVFFYSIQLVILEVCAKC